MTTACHLAQLNIATMREPLTSPSMSDFAYLVLWWVPAGHEPTVEEAAERLELPRSQGASAAAFTFARPFYPPGSLVA